jgi:hypothetical protein
MVDSDNLCACSCDDSMGATQAYIIVRLQTKNPIEIGDFVSYAAAAKWFRKAADQGKGLSTRLLVPTSHTRCRGRGHHVQARRAPCRRTPASRVHAVQGATMGRDRRCRSSVRRGDPWPVLFAGHARSFRPLLPVRGGCSGLPWQLLVDRIIFHVKTARLRKRSIHHVYVSNSASPLASSLRSQLGDALLAIHRFHGECNLVTNLRGIE